jgi:hypothetical protein
MRVSENLQSGLWGCSGFPETRNAIHSGSGFAVRAARAILVAGAARLSARPVLYSRLDGLPSFKSIDCLL